MAHKVQPSLSNISLNHDSGASSLQEQLYFKILDLIENKSLRPGDPIPSSRKLASEIEVSRSTVVSVYNRLLEEGLLETKSGNGTFVSEISLGVFENRKESLPVNEKYLPSELPLSAQIAATATGFKVQKPMPRLTWIACRVKTGLLSSHVLQRARGFTTVIVNLAALCLIRKLSAIIYVSTEALGANLSK
ncbi:GntR family transcriptional regulator [Parasutterella sp.]|uniref:GntR family transcriptional regulator n=1 Tax=Parasutterella sp. TaxID=2049037 RepID=UPI0035207190